MPLCDVSYGLSLNVSRNAYASRQVNGCSHSCTKTKGIIGYNCHVVNKLILNKAHEPYTYCTLFTNKGVSFQLLICLRTDVLASVLIVSHYIPFLLKRVNMFLIDVLVAMTIASQDETIYFGYCDNAAIESEHSYIILAMWQSMLAAFLKIQCFSMAMDRV